MTDELLAELRMLWRKQEAYVLSLQGGLERAASASAATVAAELKALNGRLERLPTAEQVVSKSELRGLRQDLERRGVPTSSASSEAPRTPLVGVVVLSSLTSAMVTAAGMALVMGWG